MKHWTLPIIAGLAVSTSVPALGLTWISYTDAIGPKEYAVTDDWYTWHDAEAFAQSQNAHLVAINDAAENAWLTGTFGGGELFWIGLTDQDQEGTFLWTNGDPFTYDNWGLGEPNDATEEEWTIINWGGPGEWNDFESGADYVNAAQGNTSFQKDSFPMRGIIERQVVVPEPGTLVAAVGVAGIAAMTVRRRIRG